MRRICLLLRRIGRRFDAHGAENKRQDLHPRAEGWPGFRWDHARISALLVDVRHRQGRLIGRMEGLGFQLRAEAVLHSLTEEVLKSSEIEGEKLDRDQVRSSIARRLGINIGGLSAGGPRCRGRRRDDARCDAALRSSP